MNLERILNAITGVLFCAFILIGCIGLSMQNSTYGWWCFGLFLGFIFVLIINQD